MKKIMAFLKKYGVWIGVAIVAYLAWRSINSRIDSASESSSDDNGVPGQMPIFTANAGGYSGPSATSSGVSTGNSDIGSPGMNEALMEQIRGANLAQLTAIKGTIDQGKQTTALNNAPTNFIADSFAKIMPSWLLNKNNQYQSINVGITPNKEGGVNFTAKTDVNLQSIPTKAQSSMYQNGSPLSNVIPFAPVAAAPAPTPKAQTKANFDSASFLAQNSDVANMLNTHKYQKAKYARDGGGDAAWGFYLAALSTPSPRQFTAVK